MATEEAKKPGARAPEGTEARSDRAQGRADGGSGAADDDLLEVALTPVEVLAALARLDVEAALAYEAAAGLADDAETVGQLRRFGRDHRRHAQALARLLGEWGGLEPERVPAEPVLAGLARVAAGLGPASLTLALLANEQLTNLAYEDVLAYAWDEAVERLLVEFRADEERHLRWLSERHGLAATPAPAAQGT
jgi:rubrerythrin